MWPEPLLASGFNRGKTTPGGGRGSRSPPVCVFPVLLADFVQRAIVCLVERVWQFIESPPDALSETVSEVLKLARHPSEPILRV